MIHDLLRKTLLCKALLLALALGGNTYAAYEFPANFYPQDNHPRLWLTNERRETLQTAMQLNTPEWQVFSETVGTLCDGDASNDPFELDNAPQVATAPLALMYLLTNNTFYADCALDYMDAVPNSITGYGNPGHQSFHYMALAYDWLASYPGMTPARKSSYQTKMAQISDSFWEHDNLLASGMDSDENLLSGMTHLMLGAAIYGEHPAAITLINRGWLGWVHGYGYQDDPIANREFVLAALGGVYFTGFAYFSSTDSLGIAGYWHTLATAFHYDIPTQEPELKAFWPNSILSLIHMTNPARNLIYHTGDWEDASETNSLAWVYRTMDFASYFSAQAGEHEIAAIAQGYAAAIDPGRHAGWFDEFFFSMPQAPAPIDPYSASLPLVHFADGPDFLLFRDNWGTNANWGFFAGDGSVPADHMAPDHGHFTLWRGNDYLTRGARNYNSLEHGDFYNTLSIENNCQGMESSCSGTALFLPQSPASIARHSQSQASPLFAYAMLEADGQWSDPPETWEGKQNVLTYRRHFFWAADYAVVFDRLRTKQAGWSQYRLRSLTLPVVSGDTISQLSENGQHKLLSRTLEPANMSPVVQDENVLWANVPDWNVNIPERRWQSVINLPVANSVNVLNVMQMGPVSMQGFDPLQHIHNAGNSGVRLGNWVTVFSTDENLRSEASYTINNPPDAASLKHLVADLSPGQYDVTVNGQHVTDINVAGGDNTAFFETRVTAGTLDVKIISRMAFIVPIINLLLDN